MLNFVTETHVGQLRLKNEDHVLAAPQSSVFVLADGVGGNKNGEVASQIACESVVQCMAQGESLQQAILSAHVAIQDAAIAKPDYDGMATTIVACSIDRAIFQISWVGDSRAYIWNGSYLQQLTRDHSYVEHLIAEEEITRQEAATHPFRHVLMHALGSGEIELLRIDTVSGSLSEGDYLLLCSDGLTGEVNDEDIATIMESELSLEDKAHCLIETANNNGGRDNITVALMQYHT